MWMGKEEQSRIIEQELFKNSPMWLPELVGALGIEELYATGNISFETLDQVESAAIRMVCVCQAFEEMLYMGKGDMLVHMAGIYDQVYEKLKVMNAGTNFTWQTQKI